MKPTREQVIAWAREAGLHIATDVHWMPIIGLEYLEKATALAYEAGRKDENEALAQMIEDAPPLVPFAQNEKGGCLMCGFTPKLAAETFRARREHG